MSIRRRKRRHHEVLVHFVGVGGLIGGFNLFECAVICEDAEAFDHVEEVVLVVSCLVFAEFFDGFEAVGRLLFVDGAGGEGLGVHGDEVETRGVSIGMLVL